MKKSTFTKSGIDKKSVGKNKKVIQITKSN